jgi:hypothetical protein
MGLFGKIKEAFSDFDDHVLQPIVNNPFEGIGDALAGATKLATGETAMKVLAKHDVVSDGAYDAYKGTLRTAATAAAVIGGIALAPATGGASLAMTYGALSGSGTALLGGKSWNKAMTAGVQGGVTGASTMLLPGSVQFSTAKDASKLATIGSNLGHNAVVYGLSGTGGAYAGTGNLRKAAMYGAGSAVGASMAGGLSNAAILASAAGMGLTAMNLTGETGSGTAPTGIQNSSNPTAGTTQQSPATKKVPEAEFIDSGAGSWGNAGLGGVFGGLSHLHVSDGYTDTEKIRKQFALRSLGKFVK